MDDLPAADRACAETHLLLTELALPLDKNSGGKPLSGRLYGHLKKNLFFQSLKRAFPQAFSESERDGVGIVRD